MMKEHKEGSLPLCTFLVRMLQGMLIGLGAVLPGISGGVLCVIFGIYRPVMELLSNPRKYFFTHIRKLLPVILGGAVGSYIVAFGYEFMRTRNKENAFALAWKAAQTQFVAMLGKIVASFAMALLLFKQIFLNN